MSIGTRVRRILATTLGTGMLWGLIPGSHAMAAASLGPGTDGLDVRDPYRDEFLSNLFAMLNNLETEEDDSGDG